MPLNRSPRLHMLENRAKRHHKSVPQLLCVLYAKKCTHSDVLLKRKRAPYEFRCFSGKVSVMGLIILVPTEWSP